MAPRAIVALVALLGAVGSSPAWTSPARAETAVPSTLPDVVLLKNGGMVRGTIVELAPDQSVSLILATGETRTIPMGEVAYAGPADAAPTSRPSEPAPPAPSPSAQRQPETAANEPFISLHANKVRLRIVGKEPNLTVYVKSQAATGSLTSLGGLAPRYIANTSTYTPLCTAPCEVSLPEGAYEFGISRPGKRVTEVGFIRVTGPGTLEAEFEPDRAAKITGISALVAGAAGGTALLFLVDTDEHKNVLAAAGALLLGMGIGIPLLALPDDARITFFPAGMTSASPSPGQRKEGQSASVFDTPGLTVVGRF